VKHILFCIILIFDLYSSVAKVTISKGDVYIVRDNKSIQVKTGILIENKDIIKSNSNGVAQIRFNDKTTITIGNNAIFKVMNYQLDEADFVVENGLFKVITGNIGKINPNRFKISTPTSTIGIRGTTIIGETDSEKDIIACTKGRIIVTSTINGETVNVDAGKITTIIKGATPTIPRLFTPNQIDRIDIFRREHRENFEPNTKMPPRPIMNNNQFIERKDDKYMPKIDNKEHMLPIIKSRDDRDFTPIMMSKDINTPLPIQGRIDERSFNDIQIPPKNMNDFPPIQSRIEDKGFDIQFAPKNFDLPPPIFDLQKKDLIAIFPKKDIEKESDFYESQNMKDDFFQKIEEMPLGQFVDVNSIPNGGVDWGYWSIKVNIDDDKDSKFELSGIETDRGFIQNLINSRQTINYQGDVIANINDTTNHKGKINLSIEYGNNINPLQGNINVSNWNININGGLVLNDKFMANTKDITVTTHQNVEGAIAGKYFGISADHIGGIFQFNGIQNNNKEIIVGTFGASK
jgi:hypothetical protein